MILAILFLAIAVGLPLLNRARDPYGRRPCPDRLRRIGLALQIYANEHPGRPFPETLEPLVTNGLLPADALICPSGDGGQRSYVYLGGGLMPNADSDVVLAYDPPGNHGTDGCQVLLGDVSVCWYPMPTMRRVLDQVATGPRPVRILPLVAASRPGSIP
jgi:hypothetical protein